MHSFKLFLNLWLHLCSNLCSREYPLVLFLRNGFFILLSREIAFVAEDLIKEKLEDITLKTI